MHILFVRMTDRISGAEKYNYYLADGLKKWTSIDPIFLTDYQDFAQDLKEQGYNSCLLPLHIQEVGTKKDLLAWFVRSPRYYYSYLRQINSLRQKYSFNIVCFESMTEKLFLTPLLKLLSYKVVWIEHGPLFVTKRAWLIKRMYVLASLFVSRIIAVSQNTKQDLIGGGVSKDKVTTIPIGIDVKDFQLAATAKLKGLLRGNVIGFVGTLNEEKGILRFMDIAEKILEKDPNISFLIVGDGPLRVELEDGIQKKSLALKFVFTGFVDDIRPYVRAMDIVLLPTKHFEGLSLAILESLAAGKIVFATDVGGNGELILNNKTGYLINAENLKLVDMILEKLNNAKEQKRIINNAVQLVKKCFNQRKQSLLFEKLFTTL